MTSSRHDHAAARSTPYGTSARLKFEAPAAITTGSRLVLALQPAHRRPLVGQPGGDALLVVGCLVRDVVATRRGTVVVAHGVNLSTTVQQARHEAVRRVGVLGGQQPGGGEHVVGVDHDPGALGKLPVAVALRCSDRGPGRPRPRGRAAARRRSRPRGRPRAGRRRCARHPALGADHHLRAAGVPAQGEGRPRRGRWPRPRRAPGRWWGGSRGPRAWSGPPPRGPAARPRRRSRPRTSACRGRPRRCG